MKKTTEKEPKSFLHTANLLTVLLMILATASGSLSDESLFRRVLFAVHLPLLFFLTGITLRKHNGQGKEAWMLFLRRMFLAYAIPYFLWALIYSAFSYRHLGWIVYASWQALNRAETLAILAFLPCMFVSRILAELVFSVLDQRKLSERKNALIPALFSFLIAVLLPKIETIGYPWCVNIAFAATGFLLTGYALRPYLEQWAKKPAQVLGGLAVSAVLFIAGTVLRSDKLYMVQMRTADYGNLFWFFANAFTGILLVMSLSMAIARTWKEARPFIDQEEESGINKITLGTFVIHMPLMQQVILPLMKMIPVKLPAALLFLIGMVLTKMISSRIIKVFVRFVPQLFGIYPSPKLLILPPPEPGEQ